MKTRIDIVKLLNVIEYYKLERYMFLINLKKNSVKLTKEHVNEIFNTIKIDPSVYKVNTEQITTADKLIEVLEGILERENLASGII
ncbi:hypothetical protein JXB41_05255 [Candidatus Woesearchaeota archaeon]|nr:hypothetical protein [Candidatus Woesearchaeota archaeon]